VKLMPLFRIPYLQDLIAVFWPPFSHFHGFSKVSHMCPGLRYVGELVIRAFGGPLSTAWPRRIRMSSPRSLRNIWGTTPGTVGVVINHPTCHTSQANKETLFGSKTRSVPWRACGPFFIIGGVRDTQRSTANVFVATR
jgi:hypothetical protein